MIQFDLEVSFAHHYATKADSVWFWKILKTVGKGLLWQSRGWNFVLPMPGVQIWSLVGELRSHMLCNVAKTENSWQVVLGIVTHALGCALRAFRRLFGWIRDTVGELLKFSNVVMKPGRAPGIFQVSSPACQQISSPKASLSSETSWAFREFWRGQLPHFSLSGWNHSLPNLRCLLSFLCLQIWGLM